jgi:hypothetical protein
MKLRPKLRCPTGTEVQTLLFSRDHFTEKEAVSWALHHDFVWKKTDVKPHTIRIRQESPSRFRVGSFRTIRLAVGIQAVIGCPR